MSGPILAVGAIVVDDERLLMVRRGHGPAAGYWAVPGGRVEPGETLAEAVVREMLEETGIEGVCGRLIGVLEVMPDATTGDHFVILDFEVTILESTEPRAGDDAAEARWVDLGGIAELQLAPGVAEFLHDHGIIETIT